MRKRIFAALMCAAFCACVCGVSSRAASDFDPDAGWHSLDGSDSVSSGFSSGVSPSDNADADQWAEPQTRVRLSDTMYYDTTRNSYVYPVRDTAFEAYSNVADGMITGESVSISGSAGLLMTLYWNGETIELNSDGNYINAAGDYLVTVKTGGANETLFRFTIVGQIASIPGGYSLPDGFYIQDATLNGEDVYYDYSYIDMEEDGLYHIEYVCGATTQTYTLHTQIDNTPPELTLNGRQDSRGRFHSAVDVSSSEEISRVVLTRDDMPVDFPSEGHIAESGLYTLQAYDMAGNSTTVQFTILIYFNMNSIIFFSLIIVSAVLVWFYIFIKRKRLKVY